MADNLGAILEYLRQLGLTRQQAAGVAGNFAVESKFDPAAANPAEGAIGIAQWEGGRRTALQQYAAAHGGHETDLMMQLGYLQQEITGPEAGAWADLKRTSSASDAAAVWDAEYERSDGSARATRQADAEKIAAGSVSIGDLFTDPVGTIGGGVKAGAAAVAGALNPFGNWQGFALKAIGGAAAATLVIVGATRTVS